MPPSTFDVNWLNDASWYVLSKNTEENATKLAEHCMKLTVVFIVSSRMRVAENPIVGYRAIQSPIQHGWPLISSASIFSPLVSMSTWTDPGFWFGRDTQVPQRSPGAPGQSSGGGMGRSPKNVTARGWKNTYGDKKKTSPYRLTLHDNIIIIIISSIHCFMFSHFCLEIQNAVCELQSQRNGPQWQPVLECSLDGLAEGWTPPADPRSSSFGQQIAFCCRKHNMAVVQLMLCNLRYFDTQAFALGGEMV